MVKVTDKLIGLDTNIFIYYFQKDKEFGLAVRSLFGVLAKKEARAVTSVITLTELLSITATDREVDALKAHFLETPSLIIEDINQTIGTDAARIRRTYGFRTPDAIQLATSLFYKVDVFVTNDKRLKAFKEITIIFLSKDINFE